MDSENPRASIISAYLIINSQIVCYNVSSTIGCELLIDTKKRDLQSLPKKLKESIPHKKSFHSQKNVPLHSTSKNYAACK